MTVLGYAGRAESHPRERLILKTAAIILGLVCAVMPRPVLANNQMIFTGDVFLGRWVAAEFAHGPTSPLSGLTPLGHPALMMGNFEAAIGSATQCGPATVNPCLNVSPNLLRLLRGTPFTAFGLANNHSGDLGPAGRGATIAAIRTTGFLPVPASETPAFVQVDGQTVALVALDLVPPRDRAPDMVPSNSVAQRLRLAGARADWVVVFVHWGAEMRNWPQPDQQAQASWLVAHGASLIIGAHPHVAITPDCVGGVPVFWSLGNLLFDQSDPLTRQGMLGECSFISGQLHCAARATSAPEYTDAPRLGPMIDVPALAACHPSRRPGLVVDGWRLRALTRPDGGLDILGSLHGHPSWRMKGAANLLEAQAARFDPRQPQMLFVVQRIHSRIDGMDDPRPYVYRVGNNGLRAVWRGSALGWPMRDAVVMAGHPDFLCALHRGDSFAALQPNIAASRIQAWLWNGSGFDLSPDETGACQKVF